MSDDDTLLFEVDAPGVHPDTVGTVDFLNAAATYFQILESVAERTGRPPLRVFGIQIVDKCAAIEVRVSSLDDAKVAAEAARDVLDERPPRFRLQVDRFRLAMRKLGAGHKAFARVGGAVIELPLDRPDAGPPAGNISLRARLVRIGGDTPKGRFEAIGEEPFGLEVPDENVARELARHLYREVDIVAEVSRSDTGSIDGGTLDTFDPVEDVGADEATKKWRSWFREHGVSVAAYEATEGSADGD